MKEKDNSQPGTNDESSNREVDLRLVLRAEQGDVEAFKNLVERYQTRAHAVAFSIINNPADAEDVVQEAFLKAYRSLSSFRGQSGFYTWFYRIVTNLAIDFARRKYRKVEAPIGDMQVLDVTAEKDSTAAAYGAQKPLSPDEKIERDQLRAQISKAIHDLSPDHRAVIILREIDGLSYSEISHVVGCSKGTVMSRLHHARKRLQKALSKPKDSVKSKNTKPVSNVLM